MADQRSRVDLSDIGSVSNEVEAQQTGEGLKTETFVKKPTSVRKKVLGGLAVLFIFLLIVFIIFGIPPIARQSVRVSEVGGFGNCKNCKCDCPKCKAGQTCTPVLCNMNACTCDNCERIKSRTREGLTFNPDKLVIKKNENRMVRKQESMADMMEDKGIIHKRATIMNDDFESFEPPWFKDRPTNPNMYDYTRRLNTEHLSLMDPRELCIAYTSDVYSPPGECV